MDYIRILDGANNAGHADRFVPKRIGTDHQVIRSKIFSKFEERCEEDVLKQDPYSWRTRNYVQVLESLLQRPWAEAEAEVEGRMEGRTEGRILRLSEPQPRPPPRRPAAPAPRGWPGIPRKRPVVGQPDIIFDLPGYQDHMHNDILDWGKWDMLVAALDNQIFMWHSPSNNVVTLHVFENDAILAAKWDPRGVYIAIGTGMGNLYIYDSMVEKMLPISWKCYRDKETSDASITAVAWSIDGHQIACGTSSGTLSLCTSRSTIAATLRHGAHEHSDILTISYSPDGQYLVTSGMDCMVRVWCLPDIVPFFEIMYANPARALAWHPWKGSQLAIGGGMGAGRGLGDGSLSLWDITHHRNLCHKLPSATCAIDAMAWNSHTAELVVSYWIDELIIGQENETPGHCRLLVLSGPSTTTDELCASSGRTRALLFNPDGTKIASASSDENLFIWNFLGKSGPLLNMYKRKIKKKNLYYKMNEINEFNNFGIFNR